MRENAWFVVVRLAIGAIILCPMPRPRNEREALEHELREELPALLAAYQQELAAGPADKTQRERLQWQIKRVEKRVVEIEARLAKPPLDPGARKQHQL